MSHPDALEPQVLVIAAAVPAALAQRFSIAGFDPRHVSNLHDALALARDHAFDLVCLVGVDAESLVASLQALGREPATRALPVVAVILGRLSDDELIGLLDAGAAEAFALDAPPLALDARLRVLFRQHRHYVHVRELSVRDELTGLYNRRFFFERLEQEVSRADRHKTTLGCLVADIDHFKAVNDTLGHEAGDRVLRAVGQVFALHTRRSDFVARVGGDEFAALLIANSDEGIRVYAEGLQAQLAALRFPEAEGLRLSLSAGFAVYPSASVRRPLEELVRAADTALISAKRLGRDRIEGSRRRVATVASFAAREVAEAAVAAPSLVRSRGR